MCVFWCVNRNCTWPELPRNPAIVYFLLPDIQAQALNRGRSPQPIIALNARPDAAALSLTHKKTRPRALLHYQKPKNAAWIYCSTTTLPVDTP
jgi:hypothetical protein